MSRFCQEMFRDGGNFILKRDGFFPGGGMEFTPIQGSHKKRPRLCSRGLGIAIMPPV